MKKAISLSIILFIILLVYQLGINYIKQEHSVKYNINKDSITYYIQEDYSYSNDDTYVLKVSDSKLTYVFDVKNYFNKQREIVKDIITYNQDDLNCIGIKFVNTSTAVAPLCSIGDKIYSHSYVMNNYDISEFLKQIPSFEYDKYKKASLERKDYGIKVNKSYLGEKELIIVYDYKRIAIHNGINGVFFTFATSDQYKNTIGTRVGRYYVIPKMTESATVNNFIKYDLDSDIKKEIPSPKITKQYYINGVHDNKLYIFDKSDMKQYVIDPYEDSIDTVSDDTHGIVIKNGKEEKISLYELANDTITFTPDTSDYSSIDYEAIYLDVNSAVYLKDGIYYRVYKKYLDSPVALFDADGVREVITKNNNVYFIKDDSIYRYNEYGTVKLVTKNEFKYNSDNIYDVYFID